MASLSEETIQLMVNKYKMNYKKPPKSYLIKLQKIKDKMSFAIKAKF